MNEGIVNASTKLKFRISFNEDHNVISIFQT